MCPGFWGREKSFVVEEGRRLLARFSLLFCFKCYLCLCGREQACFIQPARTKYAVLFLSLFSFVQNQGGATLSESRTDLSVTRRPCLMRVAVVPQMCLSDINVIEAVQGHGIKSNVNSDLWRSKNQEQEVAGVLFEAPWRFPIPHPRKAHDTPSMFAHHGVQRA